MARIQWNDDYSVLVPEFDEHHKQLIRYIGVLEESSSGTRQDPDFLAMIVQGLVDYADYHFGAEEREMAARGYPEYEAHRREHEDFKKDVLLFQADYGKGSPRLERALIVYLKDWLLTHILTSDKRLGVFMQRAARD